VEGHDLFFGGHVLANVGNVLFGRHVLDDVREHVAALVERRVLCHGGSIAYVEIVLKMGGVQVLRTFRRKSRWAGEYRGSAGYRSRVVKVSDILAAKGSAVVTVKPTETIGALSQRLRENRIGAAIVSGDGQTVDGVISERDVAYGVAIHKAELHTLAVSALMTKTVVTCSPGESVANVASTMQARNIRHIPVEESGRVVGMISIRDVLNHRTDDLLQQTNLLRAFASHTERDPSQDR
jgi:CBS domain-containing protein